MFSYMMTSGQIPQVLAAWMLDNGLGWIAFLLVVNFLLLLAGNVMEPSSIILIMAPILFPVAMKLGIDPIHFGIIITVNMEIGMCHPPVGLNLYVASGIARMGITELTTITKISKFRSSAGHDYSDDVEHCRSMKHYFMRPDGSAATWSPVAGTVSRLMADFVGTQVQITSDLEPAFTFIIFHVNLVK